MANSQVDVTEAISSVTHLDAESLTVGAQAVKRERHRIAGGAATELLDVRNVAPLATDYGAVARPLVAPITLLAGTTITTSSNVGLTTWGFPDQQLSIIVSVLNAPTGTLPTLVFSLQEIDANGFSVGAPATTQTITAGGTYTATLRGTIGSTFIVSWTIGGTTPSFTGVTVVAAGKTTPFTVTAAPSFTDAGIVVRQAGMRRSGSTTYGSNSDTTPVSSGTSGSVSISLGYLWHPSSVTTLIYRLQQLIVTWADGVGGAGTLLKFASIIAENGTPGGTIITPQPYNQGSAASGATFRVGATGAPTRNQAIATASINLGAPGCAIFTPPGGVDGQDWEMRKSQNEGWEVRLVVNTAPTVAASFSISASWREESQ